MALARHWGAERRLGVRQRGDGGLGTCCLHGESGSSGCPACRIDEAGARDGAVRGAAPFIGVPAW